MPIIKLLKTARFPILQQLKLEEACLRASADNWCLLNDGSSQPAVVMGISGKVHDHVEEEQAKRSQIQIIKRFSGGGTVAVDHNTIFATFILQAEALPEVLCYPKQIMQWTETFYEPIFGQYGDFRLQEHDYVFGHRKFGGNAQAITKQRWLHHSSLLWSFDPYQMSNLKHPMKAPAYRAGRDHFGFLCKLEDFAAKREEILEAIPARLRGLGFEIKEESIEAAESLLQLDYLKANKLITL